MRENGLLAPHRVGRTETRPHDGTIITDKVNEMWGTDRAERSRFAKHRNRPATPSVAPISMSTHPDRGRKNLATIDR
jgi:hypothetical protein